MIPQLGAFQNADRWLVPVSNIQDEVTLSVVCYWHRRCQSLCRGSTKARRTGSDVPSLFFQIATPTHVCTIACRLLGLEPSAQAQIFDFYQAVLEETIENAKKDGKYDDGIVDVSGSSVLLAEEPRTVLTVCLLAKAVMVPFLWS